MTPADGAVALVLDDAPDGRRHLPVVQTTLPPEGPRVDARGRRARSGKRPATLSVRRYPKRELDAGTREYPPAEFAHVVRPQTRGDCEPGGSNAARPCPFVSCAHHLFLSVNEGNGNVKFNFPELESWEIPRSCALDVAELGGETLERVGVLVNLTRERVRQIEDMALGAMSSNPLALALVGVESLESRGEVAVDEDGSGARTDTEALHGLSELSYGHAADWVRP